MVPGREWSERELLLAFRLYCRLPFGRLHQHNPDIVALAKKIGRTPSAVAMKACNYASLDPEQIRRGIKGLGNVSEADRALWARFLETPTEVAARAETAHEAHIIETGDEAEKSNLAGETDDRLDEVLASFEGETERERILRVRRVQRFFRSAVLVSYEGRCALSGIAVPELLSASHIIPWSQDEGRRADPRNGLCLNALYDRAFDRGLISFDDALRVMVSPVLAGRDAEDTTELPPLHRDHLLGLEGRELTRPVRFEPDLEAMGWHRLRVFQLSS